MGVGKTLVDINGAAQHLSVSPRFVRRLVAQTALVAATTRQDGKRTSADVTKRRYAGVRSVLRAAVNRDLIESNPIDKVVWTSPRKSSAVNIVTLPSVADVADIVTEMAADKAYAHYAAFFAAIGFAGLHPVGGCPPAGAGPHPAA